jgi:hypothetical protein
MNTISCPHCGGVNPPTSAFCGTCGASLAQPPAAQQPPVPSQAEATPPPPPSYVQAPYTPPPPPPGAFPPPPGAYQAPPPPPPPPGGGFPPPPGAYPPAYPTGKILGDKTKWALGLGAASIFCCGPFTGVVGLILAKQDMDEIASGRSPHFDIGWAKAAFYINLAALILSVLGMCAFFGLHGLRRF